MLSNVLTNGRVAPSCVPPPCLFPCARPHLKFHVAREAAAMMHGLSRRLRLAAALRLLLLLLARRRIPCRARGPPRGGRAARLDRAPRQQLVPNRKAAHRRAADTAVSASKGSNA